MENDLSAGNSAVATEGNPATEPSVSTNGTSDGSGEARQSAATQDSFIPEGVDVNTLPPNVRAIVDKINKDMVRGFTEKTTKLSETAKAEAAKMTEAYKQKAEQYDSIAAQEEFVKQWNDYVNKANTTTTVDAQGNPSSPELTQLKSQLNEITQKMQMAELQQVTDAFASAQDEKGQPLHPDFDKFNEFNLGSLQSPKGAEEYSLLRACIELAPGKTPSEKLTNGYKSAKATYDAIYEEGRKAGLGKLQSKVANGSQPPTNIGGNLSVTEKRPKSAAEALDMAKRGIAVSRS